MLLSCGLVGKFFAYHVTLRDADLSLIMVRRVGDCLTVYDGLPARTMLVQLISNYSELCGNDIGDSFVVYTTAELDII